MASDRIETLRELREAKEELAAANAEAAPEPDPHPDDLAVDRFATMLKAKLERARAKGRSGWQDPAWPAADINRQMHEHAGKGDPLDVAAFAMFLALRGERSTRDTETARIIEERDMMTDSFDRVSHECAERDAEIARLREALEVYADPTNWEFGENWETWVGPSSGAANDIARAALARKDGE